MPELKVGGQKRQRFHEGVSQNTAKSGDINSEEDDFEDFESSS